MRNPVTKLTAAAAVIIAVAGIAGVVLWTHTGSGIALADVLTQVQQITAYMFQSTMTISGKGPTGQDMNENMESTFLLSEDDGMKIVTDSADPNSGRLSHHEMYILFKEKTAIMLMPDLKQYMRMELDDSLIEKSRQGNYDPSSMLRQILDHPYESLGRSTIDGVEVEGFQTIEPNYPGGATSQGRTKVWVDIKTKLPVRLEMDGQVSGMQMHVVTHDFQWDYPADAGTFKVVIPPDYTTLFGGDLKMPAMDEEGAITGLRTCAELTGQYPEKLDSTTFSSLISKLGDTEDLALEQMTEEDDSEILALSQLTEEDEGLSREERVKKTEERIKKIEELMKKNEERRKAWDEQIKKMDEYFKKRQEQRNEMMDKLMSIQGAVMFYTTLTEERKDPAYYGNVVTPQDADKVLMRWKVSHSQYRVIFGSLHAETVDAPTLAELEKNLPK